MTDREMLEKLLAEISELKDGQKSLENGQKVLTDRMQGFEDRVQLELDSLKTEVRHTRVLVESDVTKKIQIVAEQHGDIIEKLDAFTDYPETRGRVATLEHVVTAHTQDIGKLKKAVG